MIAANLLLQRLMIQQGFAEKLTLYTFDSNLNPCLVHYVSSNMKVKLFYLKYLNLFRNHLINVISQYKIKILRLLVWKGILNQLVIYQQLGKYILQMMGNYNY